MAHWPYYILLLGAYYESMIVEHFRPFVGRVEVWK